MQQKNESKLSLIAYRGDRAACWFYRLHAPLIQVAKNNPDFDITVSGAITKEQLEKQFDVVILDIKMPGMDGIEVLREIKNRHPLIEVIMLTGHGSTESAVEGMKLGAYDYLLKPADFSDLTEKLHGARKRKDEQEERIRKAEAKLLLRRSGDI